MLLADVGDSVQRGANELAAWVPHLLGFLVVLIVGYFVAKLVGNVVGRLLRRVGLDDWSLRGSTGRWISKVTSSPSWLLGRVVFWVVMLGAISLAVSVLGIDALEDFVAAIYAYLPNVLAAILIFLVAGAIAAGVGTLIARTMGDTSTGKVVGTVVPILIMAVAGFMILNQLKIAPEIVTITYASLMGAIALGMALAFGLGGRDVAARMLEGAYAAGQRNREQVKQDLQQGRERAKEEADRLREKAQVSPEGDEVAGVRADAETEVVAFEPAPELQDELNR